MSSLNPLKVGSAFSLTTAIAYSLCTLVFWAWPGASVTFMNALFHGLDFRLLQSGPALFDFGAFVWALAVMAAWAFVVGALFAGILREMRGSQRLDSGLRGNDAAEAISRRESAA